MSLRGSKLSSLARYLTMEVRTVLAREPEVNLQRDTVVHSFIVVWVAEQKFTILYNFGKRSRRM